MTFTCNINASADRSIFLVCALLCTAFYSLLLPSSFLSSSSSPQTRVWNRYIYFFIQLWHSTMNKLKNLSNWNAIDAFDLSQTKSMISIGTWWYFREKECGAGWTFLRNLRMASGIFYSILIASFLWSNFAFSDGESMIWFFGLFV